MEVRQTLDSPIEPSRGLIVSKVFDPIVVNDPADLPLSALKGILSPSMYALLEESIRREINPEPKFHHPMLDMPGTLLEVLTNNRGRFSCAAVSGELTALPFSGGVFDSIKTIGLTRSTDTYAVMREFGRVLKPDGGQLDIYQSSAQVLGDQDLLLNSNFFTEKYMSDLYKSYAALIPGVDALMTWVSGNPDFKVYAIMGRQPRFRFLRQTVIDEDLYDVNFIIKAGNSLPRVVKDDVEGQDKKTGQVYLVNPGEKTEIKFRGEQAIAYSMVPTEVF